MRRRLAAGLAGFALAALFTLPGLADERAAGGRIGESPFHDLDQRLIDTQREPIAKHPFEQDIARARAAFFAALAHPDARRVAGERFADLLADKDLQLLKSRWGSPVAEGDVIGTIRAESSRWATSEWDGGVSRAAAPAFERWVDRVHRSAAHRQHRAGVLPSKAIVAEALRAHADAYRQYVRARDQAEFDRFEARQALDRARRSPIGLPLVEQGVAFFDPWRHTRPALLRSDPALRQRVHQAARDRPLVLLCRYGPADLWPDGTARHEEQVHWFGRPPASIAALLAADRYGALGTLRTATVRSACPAAYLHAEHPNRVNAGSMQTFERAHGGRSSHRPITPW